MAKKHKLKPSQIQVEDAVRTLLAWAGDDPDRQGLKETPSRVARAYKEWFKGYDENPEAILLRTFDETAGYDEIVTLRDIHFQSFCEHHLAPIVGIVHIGYLPKGRVVGISKLARVVDIFARRLQIQERLTAQIADVIEKVLQPEGVAVALWKAVAARVALISMTRKTGTAAERSQRTRSVYVRLTRTFEASLSKGGV